MMYHDYNYNPNLSGSQFKLVGGYTLQETRPGFMQAYPATYNDRGRVIPPAKAHVARAGYLSWHSGEIHEARVEPEHQRKGVASAMLDYARELHPEQHIHHSDDLSDAGRAWSKAHP